MRAANSSHSSVLCFARRTSNSSLRFFPAEARRGGRWRSVPARGGCAASATRPPASARRPPAFVCASRGESMSPPPPGPGQALQEAVLPDVEREAAEAGEILEAAVRFRPVHPAGADAPVAVPSLGRRRVLRGAVKVGALAHQFLSTRLPGPGQAPGQCRHFRSAGFGRARKGQGANCRPLAPGARRTA